MQIRPARPGDLPTAAALAMALWPENTPDALRAEMDAYLNLPERCLFVAQAQGAGLVGFAAGSLRHDYVEGTGSSPVGYLEGVYVAPRQRREGIATALVRACEDWARARGCAEFASDCALDNAQSIAFHLGAGFIEAGRLVCFTRAIDTKDEG